MSEEITALTPMQKLQAMENRFYSGGKWAPRAGDYYTSSRADLELYQIVTVANSRIVTRYAGREGVSYWDRETFQTEGFGPRRVWVPKWVLE